MRIEYLNNSVKTIHFFLARMEDHTRAFFMSLGEFRKAMEDKDLVKAAHVFRTKGQVGTGDYNQECNNFKTKQTCSYQKEKGKMCQFVHSGPTTNVGGVIRPLIIKPQEGK